MADKPAANQNTQVFRREGRNWMILLALVVAALVISTGIAMAGRWVYREYIEDKPEPVSPLEIESQGDTGPAGQAEQSQQGAGSSDSSESNQGEPTAPLPGTGG